MSHVQKHSDGEDVHRDALVLDDVPDPEPVRRDGPEPEQPQRGVPAVGRREDGRAEELPAGVREDRGERRLVRVVAAVPGAAVPRIVAHGRERALVAGARLAFALQEAVESVKMPVGRENTCEQRVVEARTYLVLAPDCTPSLI